MPQTFDNHEEQDKLRLENDILKIKLELEQGAKVQMPEGNTLPPEIENQWLNYITNYEAIHRYGPKISIYEFIGKPDYKPLHELDDETIAAELDRFYDIFLANHMRLNTICDVDDRELYRFITEEFFLHEIADHRVDWGITQYTYENFHPNHEYDIQRICEEFIETFMKEGPLHEPVYMNFADEMYVAGGVTSSKKMVEKLEAFRQLFQSFELQQYEVTSLDIRDEDAEMKFTIRFTGLTETGDKVAFAGEGMFSLIPEFYLWSIIRIEMPGLMAD